MVYLFMPLSRAGKGGIRPMSIFMGTLCLSYHTDWTYASVTEMTDSTSFHVESYPRGVNISTPHLAGSDHLPSFQLDLVVSRHRLM